MNIITPPAPEEAAAVLYCVGEILREPLIEDEQINEVAEAHGVADPKLLRTWLELFLNNLARMIETHQVKQAEREKQERDGVLSQWVVPIFAFKLPVCSLP